MNAIIAVVLGIIIGFAGEWLFDFFHLRRKTRRLEQNIADLEQQVTAAEGQLDVMAAENQRLKRAVLGITEQEGEPASAPAGAPAEDVGLEEPAEQDVWLPDFVAEVEREMADSEMEQFEEAPLEEVEADVVGEGLMAEGLMAEGLMDQEMPEVPPADEPLITEPPTPAEEPIQAEPAVEPAQDMQEEPVPPEAPEEPPETPVDMGDEVSANDQPGESGI